MSARWSFTHEPRPSVNPHPSRCARNPGSSGHGAKIKTTLHRRSERERLIRNSRAAEALTRKPEDGTAGPVPGGYATVVGRAAKLYAERLQATGEAPTISAPANSDAHRIGEAVRAELRALGLPGPASAAAKATDGERALSDLALAAGSTTSARSPRTKPGPM